MRVMVFVKANAETEAGVMPGEELFEQMMAYNKELVKAGIMLAGEGPQPSSNGVRVPSSGAERSVIDGPFVETEELVAGYWLWEIDSLDPAVEWARRCPNPTGRGSVLEIRPIYEAADFGASFTPELREKEERLREKDAGE